MVQLSIDTERDSPEHIRKVIAFLQAIVGEPPTPIRSIEPAPDFNVPTGGDMFSVFGDTPSTPTYNLDPEPTSAQDLLSQSTIFEEDENSFFPSSTKTDDDDDDDPDFFTLTQY